MSTEAPAAAGASVLLMQKFLDDSDVKTEESHVKS